MSPLMWIITIVIAPIATLIVLVPFARRSARRRFLAPSEAPNLRHRALWGYAGRDPSLAHRSASRHDAPDSRIATNGYASEAASGRMSRRAHN